MDANKTSSSSLKRKKDEFIEVAKQVNTFFNEEGVNLRFDGYIKTLNQYLSCNEFDLDTLNTLVCDLNLWADYFGELEGVVENLKLRYENKYLYLKAFPYIPKIEQELNVVKYKIDRTKLFLKHVKIQRNLFNRLHYHCFKMYNDACEHFLYRY